MPPPVTSLILCSSRSAIDPFSQAFRLCLCCFPSIVSPLLSRPYSSSAFTLSTQHPPSAPRPWQSTQNHHYHTTPTSQSPPPPRTGLSLQTKSVILATAIAVIAASGALIGASLRQEIQRSAEQGSTLFSKVGSVQVVGAEALTSATESTIGACREATGGKAEAYIRAATSERPVIRSLSVEGGEIAAGTAGENGDIAAQIKVLEARKAALVQQRLVTEKKMEGLRQRSTERARREEESRRGQAKGMGGEGR